MVVGMPPVVCLGQVVSEYNRKWKRRRALPGRALETGLSAL